MLFGYMFGLCLIADMELSQPRRTKIEACREHLLYPDRHVVGVRSLAYALRRSGISSGRHPFCPVVYLYSRIVLQHRLLPDLFGEQKKLSRTELPLAAPRAGDYPDSGRPDIAAWGRNCRIVAGRRYANFYISSFLLRFITAIAYIVPTCLLLSRYYKQAVVQKVDTDRKSFSIRSSHWLVVLFVLFICYMADRVFAFGSLFHPMARPPECV